MPFDTHARVDSRFSFRRLADEGRWVPEAYTTGDVTHISFPILLTGRRDAVLEDLAGENLLRDAARRYEIEVYGVSIGYHDAFDGIAARCLDDRDHFEEEPAYLYEILLRAYFWRVFPRFLQRPLAEDDFRAFMKGSSLLLERKFFESLSTSPLDRRFFFLHLYHPHPPFVTTTEGEIRRRPAVHEAFYRAARPEDIGGAMAYYRDEIAHADRVVGRIREILVSRKA